MEIVPTPFLLGTSPASLDKIYPAEVTTNPNLSIKVEINGLKYDNNFDQSAVDKNFATMIYCKKTKTISIIHNQCEMLKANIKRKINVETDDLDDDKDLKQGIHLSGHQMKLAKKKGANLVSDHVKSDLMLSSKLERAENLMNRTNNLATKENSLTFILPEFDIYATDVTKAYSIQKLIPDNLKYELSLYISKLTSVEKDPEFPSFSIVNQLINDKIDKIRQDEVLFGYFYLLVYTYNLSPAVFTGSSFKNKLGASVAEYLHTTFSSVVDLKKDLSTRKMTKTDRFRLLNYILIIYLSFNDYNTKLSPELRKDFLLPDNKLIQAFSCIGATVKKVTTDSKDSGIFQVKLTAPLKFIAYSRK